MGADGDFAVITDPDFVLLAPDKGPPRTGRCGAKDGSFFGDGLLAGCVRGGAEFAVDFVLIDVGKQLVQQLVGTFQFHEVVGRKQWREPFLPVIMAALAFAFGLGSGCEAQGDAVEVEGGTELGESVGCMGEEKGMVIHIEGQRESVGFEGAGEEVEVGQEGFAVIEARTGVVTGGVVEDVQQGLFVGISGEPGMGAGVVLPESAQVPDLPAFDGFGRGLVTGVGGQLVLNGPAADAGTVGFEVEAAVEFAGAGVVGGGRFGRKQFGEQGGGFSGPLGMMVAAGDAGRP